MINRRNEIIHPQNLKIEAMKSKNLIQEHDLKEDMAFEHAIIDFVVQPNRVTRAMSKIQTPLEPLTEGFDYPKKLRNKKQLSML